MADCKRILKSISILNAILLLIIGLCQIIYVVYCLFFTYASNVGIIIPMVTVLCGKAIITACFLVCRGTIKEIRTFVKLGSVILCVVSGIQIIVGLFALAWYRIDNEDMKKQVADQISTTYNLYSTQPARVHLLQMMMKCCGETELSDWKTALPSTCCSEGLYCSFDSVSVYKDGCLPNVINFISFHFQTLGYTSFVSGIIELFAAIIAFCLGRRMKRF